MVPTQITESHSRALSHGASDRDAALALAPRHLLIDGRFVPVSGGRTLGVGDPATGRILAEVADATLGDCLAALEAAVAAQASWAGSAPRERSRILRHAADRLRDEIETLANILTAEMGKPLAESRAEVEFAADYLEWFGEEAVRVAGRTAASPDGHSQHLVVRTPVGPCLVITPWNFPLAVPARGIGPALAAGCTVVLRPSSLTPLSALALGRILIEAGLPAGVLNIVVSSEDAATDPLLRDGRIRKLTFTGSEAVGRHLIAQSAEQVLRVSAELGGCAPFVVFADADMDEAVEGAFAAKMRNGGAACTAANRFYIQRPIYAEFTRRLAARVAGVRIGRGTRAGVGLGPMISERHVARLAALVDDAVTRGARVVVAGGPVPGDGHFFTPVVLAEVPQDARVMREEIFGPVVAIAPFDTEDEALALANDHDAGPRRLPLHQRSGAGHAPRWGDPGGHGRHKPRPGQLRGGPLRRRRPLRLRPLRRGRGHRRVPGHPVPHDIDGGRAMSRGLTRHPVTIDEWRHPMLPMHRFHYLIRQAVLATLRAEADRHAQLLARIADAHPAACITGAASDEFAAFRGGRGRLVEEEVRVDLDCHGDLHPCGDGNQLRSSNRDPTGSNPTPIPEVSTMRPAAAVRSTCSSARPTAITTSTIGRSRVACLLDGADGAGALLAEGARRAADGGSSLSLIYVDVSLLTPLVCLDGFVWIPDPDAVEADVRGWLGELAMQYPQAEAVFLRGDPATEVAAWAESQRPEVLLVGRRGGRLRRLLLGDPLPRLRRSAGCPVVEVSVDAPARRAPAGAERGSGLATPHAAL